MRKKVAKGVKYSRKRGKNAGNKAFTLIDDFDGMSSSSSDDEGTGRFLSRIQKGRRLRLRKLGRSKDAETEDYASPRQRRIRRRKRRKMRLADFAVADDDEDESGQEEEEEPETPPEPLPAPGPSPSLPPPATQIVPIRTRISPAPGPGPVRPISPGKRPKNRPGPVRPSSPGKRPKNRPGPARPISPEKRPMNRGNIIRGPSAKPKAAPAPGPAPSGPVYPRVRRVPVACQVEQPQHYLVGGYSRGRPAPAPGPAPQYGPARAPVVGRHPQVSFTPPNFNRQSRARSPRPRSIPIRNSDRGGSQWGYSGPIPSRNLDFSGRCEDGGCRPIPALIPEPFDGGGSGGGCGGGGGGGGYGGYGDGGYGDGGGGGGGYGAGYDDFGYYESETRGYSSGAAAPRKQLATFEGVSSDHNGFVPGFEGGDFGQPVDLGWRSGEEAPY